MAHIPLCAVISGGCLLSQHSTSKQVAAGPILEKNIKSFFCTSVQSSWYTLLLQQSSASHLIQNVLQYVKSESMLQRGSCI